MEDKGQNTCPFEDAIISYIYDELSGRDRERFESHLVACQVCTDDFAAVSEARFEAYDWKRTEFDSLVTPQIAIPYREPAVPLGARLSAWLSWATVVPVAAAILVVFGIASILLFRSNGETPIAANPIEAAEHKPTLQPAIVEPRVPQPEIARANNNLPAQPKPQPAVARRRTVVPQAQYARRVAPAVNLAQDVAVNVQPTMQRAPRLAAYEDERDTSLRLSDLFDENNPPQE